MLLCELSSFSPQFWSAVSVSPSHCLVWYVWLWHLFLFWGSLLIFLMMENSFYCFHGNIIFRICLAICFRSSPFTLIVVWVLADILNTSTGHPVLISAHITFISVVIQSDMFHYSVFTYRCQFIGLLFGPFWLLLSPPPLPSLVSLSHFFFCLSFFLHCSFSYRFPFPFLLPQVAFCFTTNVLTLSSSPKCKHHSLPIIQSIDCLTG